MNAATFTHRLTTDAVQTVPLRYPDGTDIKAADVRLFRFRLGSGNGVALQAGMLANDLAHAHGLDDGAGHRWAACWNCNDDHAFGNLESQTGISDQYSIMSERGQAFFGGYIEIKGYVSAVRDGEADLTFDQIDYGGIDLTIEVFAAEDGDLQVEIGGISAGTTATAFRVEALLTFAFSGGGTATSAPGGLAWGWFARDGQGFVASAVNVLFNTDAHRYERTDRCLGSVDAASGAGGGEETGVSFGSASGFTLSGAAGGVYVAFGGIKASAKRFTTSTAVGIKKYAFDIIPKLALFSSVGATPSSSSQDDAHLVSGATDGSRQFSHWTGLPNNIGSDKGARKLDDTAVMLFGTPNNTGTTFEARAEFFSFVTDPLSPGIKLKWTAVDAVGREWIAIVLGDASDSLENPCDAEDQLIWGATRTRNAAPDDDTYTSRLFSKAPLRDPSTYCGGWKSPRAMKYDQVTWAASDWATGEFNLQTFGFQRADTDYAIRTALEQVHERYELGSEAWLLWYSTARRRARQEPTLIAHGVLITDGLDPYLGKAATASDSPIGNRYALYKNERMVPNERFSLMPSLTNLPKSVSDLAAPILITTKSDEAADVPGGMLELIDCGDYTINGLTKRLLIACRHACVGGGFINSYQGDNGADPPVPSVIPWDDPNAWWPGKSNWTDLVPSGALYIEIDGFRLTPMFVDGPRADALDKGTKIYANMNGLDRNADGTGTGFEDGPESLKVLFLNWGIQDYRTGPLLGTTTFELYPGGPLRDLVDEASFDQATLDGTLYLPAGLKGNIYVGAGGKQSPLREVMKDAANTFMLQWYVNEGQYGVRMWSRDREAFLDGNPTIIGRYELKTFQTRLREDCIANRLSAQYAPNYRSGEWKSIGPLGDNETDTRAQASRRRLGVIEADLLSLPFTDDPETAELVARQHLEWKATPHHVATWTGPWCELKRQLTSGWTVTHYNGPGPVGYVDNAFRIEKRTLDPETRLVTIEATDVDKMFPPLNEAGASGFSSSFESGLSSPGSSSFGRRLNPGSPLKP